jgi:hypothetical protein
MCHIVLILQTMCQSNSEHMQMALGSEAGFTKDRLTEAVNTAYAYSCAARTTFHRAPSDFAGNMLRTSVDSSGMTMIGGHERSVALELIASSVSVIGLQSTALELACLACASHS